MNDIFQKTILQINCDANWGSIGRISEQIGALARQHGWKTYLAYGRDYNPSSMNLIHVGSKIEVYEHYAEHRFFDNDGLASRVATRSFIKIIEEIKPDLIHLHNIHDHWLNYEVLFKYLGTLSIPIVWTQHDCWSFTGGCGYYSLRACDKWKVKCSLCPMKRGMLPLIDKTEVHYEKKKRLFGEVKNLTLVPVSKWLEKEIRQSFFQDVKIRQIYNGIDVSTFHPVEGNSIKSKFRVEGKKLIVAAATTWSDRKGLNDYIELSKLLDKDVIMVLVGLSNSQKKVLPQNVVGLTRTQNVQELVELYSAADIVMNLSYEETFGLTTVEGFACGTPGIVYNCTASPELITKETGIVVSSGDINGISLAVKDILEKGKDYYKEACRSRAVNSFNKDDKFNEYIKLYEELMR